MENHRQIQEMVEQAALEVWVVPAEDGSAVY
jgi:hypothetical protein